MEINNLEKFKAKMTAGRMCVGTVITLSDPVVSELAGDCGMDFTWIDAEHAPFSLESILGHVMAIRGTDCAPLVRVAWNDLAILKPVLDLAPAGVIIPMVNSAEEAREAVAACKYPLRGKRGCGVRRATRFGKMPFAEYVQISETEPMVIIQIEHIDAVKNLDAILKVPGIDSICIGPCDLSGSMGKLAQTNDPEVVQVIEEICSKTRQAGLLLGTASGPYEIWKQRGLNWIAITSDCGGMISNYQQILEKAK
ncbi:MAG: aldolase/citrate lyase family protein [Lentisphaeria bacterium]